VRSIRKVAAVLLVIVSGCGGASQRGQSSAAAAQLAELQSLATDVTDLHSCARYQSVARDFEKAGIDHKRSSHAYLYYYSCLERSADEREHRSDEIGAAAQSASVKAASERVSEGVEDVGG
jgi:hypothetical protein